MPARSRDNHIVLDYVYRFEYLQGYLRHYSVAACFDGSPAPRRKGETSQFTGKPIISITYRGFSREVVPVRYSSLCIAILGNPLLRLTWLAGRLEFVASLTVGVGNRPILAERANVGRSAAPGDRLRLIRPDPASIAVGVGSNSNGMKTVLPFSHCFNPCVCTVGNKPASVPSVGRADTASRYNVRLHFVSCRFQVRTHRVEDHSFRPVNNSVNVFANDPVGSNSPNNPQHFRPEVAVVLRALALACETERLAGETACEHVDAVSPNGKVCCSYVSVLFCIWKMVFEDFSTKRVYLAVEGVRPSRPLGSQIKTADAAEKGGVGHRLQLFEKATHICQPFHSQLFHHLFLAGRNLVPAFEAIPPRGGIVMCAADFALAFDAPELWLFHLSMY